MNRLRNQEIKLIDGKKRYYKYLKYPEIPVDISDIYIITKIGENLDKYEPKTLFNSKKLVI